MSRIWMLCVALFFIALGGGLDVFAQRKDRSLENLKSRILSNSGGKDYVIDVYELTDDKSFGYLLQFRCTNCKPEYVYEEIVENHFDYSFALSSELILTEWSTGVASGIQVYHLGKEVRRVLKFYGRGGPRYTYSGWGEPKVIMYDYRDEGLLETYHRATWTWTGNEFVEKTECIAGCEALGDRRR